MLKIKINTVSHEAQRYPTVGDWQIINEADNNKEDFEAKFTISNMNNTDYEFLVGIHELIEAYLCQKREIKEEDVTDFDMVYEEGRIEGEIDEPGDDPRAPYHKEHVFATNIEKQLATELGVDWDLYDKTVKEL